ncbi:hypothetical protein D9757_004014 [Collybiopsis confluens]|uniref:Uncharacterized protein n=1 Tax=Collybiopsis confluens TaxID=2823264 RepID=A0A8H5HWX7_9AGAR|nr:hypothetical protein D9757_004014 [Collybiopsis confluens]
MFITNQVLTFALGALTASALLNVMAAGIQLYASHVLQNFDIEKHPTTLPVRLHPAVMIMDYDGEHYGLDHPKDWAALIPKGHGFVRLNDPVHTRLTGHPDSFYQVTAFHQIHCLMGWRQYFQWIFEYDAELKSGRNHTEPLVLSEHNYGHAEHCASYMVQLKLCAGDVTLEPTTTKINRQTGRRVHAVDSDGIKHRCKDWSQVKEFLESNHEGWKNKTGHFKGDDLN